MKYSTIDNNWGYVIIRRSKIDGLETYFKCFSANYEFRCFSVNAEEDNLPVSLEWGLENWIDDYKSAHRFNDYTECRAWFDSLDFSDDFQYEISIIAFDTGLTIPTYLKTIYVRES